MYMCFVSTYSTLDYINPTVADARGSESGSEERSRRLCDYIRNTSRFRIRADQIFLDLTGSA